MKLRLKKTGTILLALTLLTFFACAFADGGFAFRTGVTWDMTPAEMMATEGVHDYDVNFHQNAIHDQFTRYYILDREDGLEDTFYVYRGDAPVLMGYILLSDTKAVPVYDREAEAHTARWGEPADCSAEDIHALLSIIWPARLTLEDFERVTAWRLEDGTLAALLTVDGVNFLMYINEQRLLVTAA